MLRRAVIDVGTNSVKLLLADISADEIKPVTEASQQTRLGRGFYENHRLQPDAIASTARAVAKFADDARAQGAQSVRVIATSAARDAVNAGDLIFSVQQTSGLPLEIISGEQEAEWAFQGVTTDPEFQRDPLLLLDVGGGSTEFILGCSRQKHFQASYPLGTVRLMEQLPHSDPPKPEELRACSESIHEFLSKRVCPQLELALRREIESRGSSSAVQLVGTGGTATILAMMEARLATFDRDKIEGARLNLESVGAHLKRLWSLPLATRQETVGLPKNRADVILTGIAIYEAVMVAFGFDELRISTRGLRYAAVMNQK
jgi:exopolyphosphatase/guanosine-5'-triphosphate,3'-diphosphate pyrophosphatase